MLTMRYRHSWLCAIRMPCIVSTVRWESVQKKKMIKRNKIKRYLNTQQSTFSIKFSLPLPLLSAFRSEDIYQTCTRVDWFRSPYRSGDAKGTTTTNMHTWWTHDAWIEWNERTSQCNMRVTRTSARRDVHRKWQHDNDFIRCDICCGSLKQHFSKLGIHTTGKSILVPADNTEWEEQRHISRIYVKLFRCWAPQYEAYHRRNVENLDSWGNRLLEFMCSINICCLLWRWTMTRWSLLFFVVLFRGDEWKIQSKLSFPICLSMKWKSEDNKNVSHVHHAPSPPPPLPTERFSVLLWVHLGNGLTYER